MMDLSLRLSLVLVLPTLFPVIVVSEDRAGGEKSCRTGKQDQRSDIFSLGVTLYEMLAGQVPFSADDLAPLMFQLSSAAPRPPSAVNPAVPGMFDLIAGKALEKLPDSRYQNARELAADLRACRAELGGEHPMPASEPAKTQTLAGKAQKLGAATVAGMKPMQLALARRFDSSAALQRLAAPEVTTSASRTMPINARLRLWFADPQQRVLAATIGAAVVAGLLIAFT